MTGSDRRADNLISRLFSYSPREGSNPVENFCTEALAWCLRQSPTFRKQFIGLLKMRELENYAGALDFHTQMSFKPEADDEEEEDDARAGSTFIRKKSGGCFDMVILPKVGREFAIVVEVKVKSGFRKDQRENVDKLEIYRRELDNGDLFAKVAKNCRWIVTLTERDQKHPLARSNIRWADVQSRLERAITQAADDGSGAELVALALCKQFADFLGEKDMKPITIPKTRPEQLHDRMTGIVLVEKIKTFLKSVRNQDDELSENMKTSVKREKNDTGDYFAGIYSIVGAPYLYFGVQFTKDGNETPDYSLVVEAPAQVNESMLRKKLSSQFKNCSFEPWVDSDGTISFCLKQEIVPNFDGGDKDQMTKWLLDAIQEAKRLSALK